MNRQQMIGLAHAVRDLRPQWHQPGILQHIQETDDNWTGTDAQLYAHIVQVAANPLAQTPAAFHAKMPTGTPTTPTRGINEPNCYICGRRKTDCQTRQDWEIEHGIPDPHVFETEDDATQNARPLTAERKTAIMAKVGTLLKNVNDVPGMAHAVEAAKLAEQRTQETLT